MTNKEIWKQIEDCPKYEVSNLGNVRSAAYWCNYDNGYKEYHEATLLIPIPESNGTIYVNFESRHLAVHLLVARAFLKEPSVPSFVQFIDGDVSNCSAENLQYVTVSDFTKKQIAEGNRKAPQPYKGKSIICLETKETFESIKSLCEHLGLKRYVVAPNVISGKPINGYTYVFVKR